MKVPWEGVVLGFAGLTPYMVSPRIARHCVLNDMEQVAAIYPASHVGGVESPGPRCRSRVSSSSTYRFREPLGFAGFQYAGLTCVVIAFTLPSQSRSEEHTSALQSQSN